ncbi:MAG: hypothetical protein JWO63_1382 [Frankiales bacterium]|nr:hypothetical protein [Frankiales bacterium]
MSTTELAEYAADYDYLIVGGGTAGCVLAARLSEDADCSVLLIEAGPDELGPPMADPGRWTSLMRGEFDWGYDYEPSAATGNRVIGIPRGRVIGGSSATNALLWYRGHPSDYDAWAAAGATGWDYASLLPYFKRAEDWQGGASSERGVGGPMRIETSPDPHPIAAALLLAAAELGLPVIEDPNGPSNLGAAYSNLMIAGGRRCSAAVGYLQPARDRANLRICCDSTAVGLVFDGRRCVGVRHLVGGAVRTTRARREVLLCLGAIDSPRLLLLAGIGDPAQLREWGLPVRAALPAVGQNLQDHPLLMGLNFRAKAPLGPIRDNGGGAMINWCSDDSLPAPDLHAFVVQGQHAEASLARAYGLPANSPDGDSGGSGGSGDSGESGRSRGEEAVFAISPGLMRARSVGRLWLASADPRVRPRIQPNFLGDRSDLEALMSAIDTVLDLAATQAYADLIDSPAMPPGRLSSAEQEAFVRATCSTFFHVAGTCAIGPVLAADLTVHGVDGLRVVDASVFPSLPSCNTTAPVIAVAERAADLIRQGAR